MAPASSVALLRLLISALTRRVAYNSQSNEYLVVAEGLFGVIQGQRVKNGKPDGSQVSLMGRANQHIVPKIIYNTLGDNYLLVAGELQDIGNNLSKIKIFTRKILANGQPTGTEVLIREQAHGNLNDGVRFSVAYAPIRSVTPYGHFLLAVDKPYDLTMLGDNGTIVSEVVNPNNGMIVGNHIPFQRSKVGEAYNVDVAYGDWNGEPAFLVIWGDRALTAQNKWWPGIWGGIVDAEKIKYLTTGSPSNETFPISRIDHLATLDDAKQWKPVAAYNSIASKFMVAWREIPTQHPTNNAKVNHIRANAIGSFEIPPPDNVVLSATNGNEDPKNPAIATSTKNPNALVVWEDNRNFSTTDVDIYGTLYTTSALPPNTPKGNNVEVDMGNGVKLTLDDVTKSGYTTLQIDTSHPAPLPNGFAVLPISGGKPKFYRLETSADFNGNVKICIQYDATGLTQAQEKKLSLEVYESPPGQWKDITSSRDLANHKICGEVTHLSDFAIMAPIGAPDIDVQTQSLSASVVAGATTTKTLTIANTGGADLTFNISSSGATGSNKDVLVTNWGDISTGNNDGINTLLNQMIPFIQNQGYTVAKQNTFPASLDGYEILILVSGGANIPNSVVDNFVNSGKGLIVFESAIVGERFNVSANSNPVQSFSGWDLKTNATVSDAASPLTSGVSANCTFQGYATTPTMKSGVQVVMQWSDKAVFAASYEYGKGKVVYIYDIWSWWDYYWQGDVTNGEQLLKNALQHVLPGSASVDWLSFNPASATVSAGAQKDVSVTFDATALSARTYEANININSNDPDEGIVTVPATMNVTPGTQPVLSVKPTTLDFGASLTSLTFQISNTSGGTLTWNVTESPDKSWITSVSPASGNGNATVTATVDRAQLSGNSDTGTLVVNCNGGNQNVTVLISKGSQANITPDAPATAQAGQEFWVAVIVNQVIDLFGVSVDLNYPTTYINYIQSQITNPGTGPGNLLGSDLLFFDTPDDPNGKVSFGITKKVGQSAATGSGPVVWAKFVSLANTPDLTQITWSCSNVTANDPNGNPITLIPQTATTTISVGCIVWPGDTNNDGLVNAADVLPIGLYFGSTGSSRPAAALSWTGQSVPCWTPENATYADANGNGSVGAEDVLAIGLNWGKTPTSSVLKNLLSKTNRTAATTIQPVVAWASGDSFRVDIQVTDVTDLFGIAFNLLYTVDRPEVEALGVETDPFMGTDLVFFSQINTSTKTVNVGLSRKAGQGGVSGNGKVASMYFKGNLTSPAGTVVTFELQNVTANDPNGTAIAFTPATGNFVTDVKSTPGESNAAPETFVLFQNYPNPFNPTTTIKYTIPQLLNNSTVKLEIYNTLGQQMRTLVNETQPPGSYSVQWDGKSDSGRQLSSGIYVYRLTAGNLFEVKKMILLK